MNLRGSVLEPVAMARFHLMKALEYTSRDDIAERTGIGASTLQNIQYGACEFVRVGQTKLLRTLAKELAAEGRNVNPWKEFVEDSETRAEIAKLRAPNPKLKQIRKAMAEKAQKASK